MYTKYYFQDNSQEIGPLLSTINLFTFWIKKEDKIKRKERKNWAQLKLEHVYISIVFNYID